MWDANGNVVGRQDYAPFGRPLFPVAGLPKQGFGGQETDAETDQAYFHARMLQMRTGRFSSVDPMFSGIFVSGNQYGYARGNPLVFMDPFGLQEVRKCEREGRATLCVGFSETVSATDPGGSRNGNAGGFSPPPMTFAFEGMARPTGPPGQRIGPAGGGAGRPGASQGDQQVNQIVSQVATTAGKLTEVQTYVEVVVVSAIGGVAIQAGAGAVGAENSIGDLFFGRYGIGLLNSNPYIRLGYGWRGTADAGEKVFRLSLGNKALGWHKHFDLWKR